MLATSSHGVEVYQVWKNNLKEAFGLICEIVEDHPYVSLDTEFPGIVARPTCDYTAYSYKSLQCNVDLTNIVQLGLTFSNSKGEHPRKGPKTFQFNFFFDLDNEVYFQESVEFLKQAGIDFGKLQSQGVEIQAFGELLNSSGLIINEDVSWIVCHGSFDLGFVYKLATCELLPETYEGFRASLAHFFPHFYDIKYIVKCLKLPVSQFSLKNLAEYLEEIPLPSIRHQAGYDSMLIDQLFFKLVSKYFDNKIDDTKYASHLYGLGNSYPQSLPAGMLRIPASSSMNFSAHRALSSSSFGNKNSQSGVSTVTRTSSNNISSSAPGPTGPHFMSSRCSNVTTTNAAYTTTIMHEST